MADEAVVIGSTYYSTAVVVGDWLINCQSVLNLERKQWLFTHFIEVFERMKPTGADAPTTSDRETCEHFLECLDDIHAAYVRGHADNKLMLQTDDNGAQSAAAGGAAAAAGGAAPSAPAYRTVSFAQLKMDTEDVLLFFVVLAKAAVTGDPAADDKFVLSCIQRLADYRSDNVAFRTSQLRVLMRAFNLLQNTSLRFDVLERLMRFALEHQMPEALFSYAQRIAAWVETAPSDRRTVICSLLVQILASKPDSDSDRLALLRLIIEDLDRQPAAAHSRGARASFKLSEGEKLKLCAECAVLSLRLSDVVLFDSIVGSPSMCKLSRSPQHVGLWNLLTTFHEGSLKSFDALPASIFEQWGLDQAALRRKLAMVVVCGLASAAAAANRPDQQVATRSIPIVDIATTLGVTEDEAESIAARAVATDLIDGHIDQLSNVLKVASGLQRSFTKEHWVQLHQRVTALSSAITQVLSTLFSETAAA